MFGVSNNEKPLVTLALFAYNQSGYVREAIEGALAQDYYPLEIVLSDDCSTDDTFEIMQQAAQNYRGPHTIVLNRNPKNLNMGGHVNRIGELARGQLVVAAAGDDISLPNRTTRLVAAWQAAGAPSAVLYSDFVAVDQNSAPVDLGNEVGYPGPHSLEDMAKGAVDVLGAATAMTSDLFTNFPLLSPTIRHEDRVLPFRALLVGGEVLYVDEKLVRYRAVGGISRNLPKTLREYLSVYTPSIANRTLPDALQRLSDALYAKPNDLRLRYMCESTIADHESRLAFNASSHWAYEAVLFQWIFRGARKLPLFKHYLKMRFSSAFH